MMHRRRELIDMVFGRLSKAFGPQRWWPAESPFEMIVGAILTQNTNWGNVERSIDALRAQGLLEFESLCRVDQEVLAPLIRSSGYYNQKAKKLAAFCLHVQTHWEGDLQSFLSQDMERLRPELLSIRGIGPETADSIILYAARQPSFVVDTYTHRIFNRHGWISEEFGYDELRDFFMDCLEPDAAFFNEYHALLVQTGKLYCRRKPLCEQCPLGDTFTEW